MGSKREKLPPGKVPFEVVSRAIRSPLPPEVLLGPGQGEDAALVDINGEVFAVASDPVTFTSREAGRLSVVVNANDVAVRGAKPLYYTAVVLLSPDEACEEEAAAVLGQIQDACDSLGVALIGGHTEVTPGLPRTLIAGTMLGKVIDRPITTKGLEEGDWIGMTKWAGLEGTSILMSEFEEEIRNLLGKESFDALKRSLSADWLSVVPEAVLAAEIVDVTAMHDVTEGGVGEGLHEMAAASGLAIEVHADRIPLLPGTAGICARAGVHPLGLIGSGALLIGCREGGRSHLEAALAKGGIPFAWIARAGKAAGTPGTDAPRFKRDEIIKAFAFFEKGRIGP